MIKRIAYIGTILIGIYLIVNLTSTITHLWQRQEEVTSAQKELEGLKKENRDLQVRFEYTQGSEFLEKQAREKLGLVLPGEKQVIIEEELLQATESTNTIPQPTGQNWWANWKKWWKLFF